MPFKSFINKAWNTVKKGAKGLWNTGKRVVNTVSKLASPVASVVAAIPGKVGWIGSGIKTAVDTLRGLTENIPNKQTRDKINNAITKTGGFVDKVVDRVDRGAKTVGNIIDTGQEIIKNLRPLVM